jgi:hypothetical protein
MGAFVVGVAALLAGMALVGRGSEGTAKAESAQTAAPKSPRQTSGTDPGGTSASGQEPHSAPRFEAKPCWQDLERFNEAVTIETFREWAAPLLASRDPIIREYLKERLTELIGNDPGRALEVLGWAGEASPRDFKVFTTALKDSEAIHLPQVAARLTDLCLDGNIPLDRRAGLLTVLDTQKKLSPAVIGKLTDFAKDPGSGEAGWAATRTLARVMKADFQQTGNAKPYLDGLLTIGTTSPDEEIRYLAVSMPMDTAPVLDAQSTERYAKILATEGSELGRDAAAHNLSLSQDKAKVLEIFAQSFETEQDVCVRWAVFRFAARAAGKNALPVMANMAIHDPRFQPVYQDFERIYTSGVLDFERVWLSLSNQDPFGCLHHD